MAGTGTNKSPATKSSTTKKTTTPAPAYGINKVVSDIAKNYNKVTKDVIWRPLGDLASSIGAFLTSTPEPAPGKGLGSQIYGMGQKDLYDRAAANSGIGQSGTAQGQAAAAALAKYKADQAKAAAAAAAAKAAKSGVTGGGTGGGTGTGGTAAPAKSPIDTMYSPLFSLLAKQRQQLDDRYSANVGDITNIYGQITTARKKDITSTDTAFQQLSTAAQNRSTAVNTGIDTREAARLNENKALLESMGMQNLSAVGSAGGDIESQNAAAAKNLGDVQAQSWQNLLTSIGAVQKEGINTDIAGYNYRSAEDQALLRNRILDAQQALDAKKLELTSNKAEAAFNYAEKQKAAQAAAAASAARARTAADKAAATAAAKALQNGDYVTKVLVNATNLGVAAGDAQAAADAYYSWMANKGVTAPAGQTTWKLGTAQADAQKTVGGQLKSIGAKNVLNQLLAGSFKP